MNQPILRFRIQEKLRAGRLPHDYSPRFWGGPGNGEICDGCEETVTKDQLVMEIDAAGCEVRFHVACFHLWDVERQVHRHETRERA